MARSLKAPLDRMSHRRRIGLLLVLFAGLAAWASRRGAPTMTPVERALVGEWGRAETDPRLSFTTTAGGPLTHPWLVQEFASDRSYRQWIVSADDTSNHFLHVEGRWRVIDGAIRFEDRPLNMERVTGSVGNWIASRTGLPVASPTAGVGATHDIPFRLVSPDDLVLDFPKQDRHDWTRLPGSFRDRRRLEFVRTQPR